MNDPVNAPAHYTQFPNAYQPMAVAHHMKLANWQYQILKYITRHNLKNGLEDLRKAQVWLVCQIWYAEHGEYLTPNQLEITITKKEIKQ